MTVYDCDLLNTECFEQLIKFLQCMAYNVLAMVYLQQFTCNGVLATEIVFVRNSYYINTYEVSHKSLCNPKVMVKTVWKLDENWLRYQRIASEQISMLKVCCKRTRAICMLHRESSRADASKTVATCDRGLRVFHYFMNEENKKQLPQQTSQAASTHVQEHIESTCTLISISL